MYRMAYNIGALVRVANRLDAWCERCRRRVYAQGFRVEPVSAALVLLGVGFTAGSTATLVAATLIVAVGTSLVSTGISMIARSILGDKGPSRPPSISPADSPVRQIVRQATPRQRYIYGRSLAGGAIFYMASKPPYLIVGYLIAAHKCDALEAVYINGIRCEFTSGGQAKTAHFRRNGVPYLTLSARLGDADQAIDPLLAAEFPELPSTFRQRGTTTVVLKAYYGTDAEDHEAVWGPGGQFTPQFLIRGRPVYDPRGGSQDVDDEATWAWSDNWALCLADWIRAPFGGRKMASQIDYGAVAETAALCDQNIGLKAGGTERRYTLNGGFASDENPFSVLDGMLNAAGEAAALWVRGTLRPLCDVPLSAVRTLTQDDLCGPFTYRNTRPRNSSLNIARSEFIHPDRDYKAAMTPPLVDAGLVASDGQPLEATIRRPFVAGYERAQRLDKITLRRSRLGRELRFPVGIEHFELEVGDEVNIEMRDFSFLDGAYVIRETQIDEAVQKINLTLGQAASTDVHAWTTEEVQDTELAEILEAA